MINYKKFISISIFCIFIINCGEKIPMKEMLKAKKAIKAAYTVKAEKYANDLLEQAKNLLFQTHDNIKKDELDKAKKSAIDSEKKAIEAYEKAVKLLAEDTIKDADKSIEEAKVANAEKWAKDDLALAMDQIKKAKDLYDPNAKYYDAYLAASEADKNAKNARNNSIAKKNILKDAIDSVKNTLTQAEKYNVEKFAQEKFKLAKDNLKIAEDSYNEDKLKKGDDAIVIAQTNADDALVTSMSGSAKEKIVASEDLLEKAKKSEGADVAKDELTAATDSLTNAKNYLNNSKYSDAITSADESSRLSTIVMGTKKPTDIVDKDKDKGKDGDGGDDGLDGNVSSKDADKQDYHLFKVRSYQKYQDCLWNISYRYYKNPRLWKKIYQANKNRISNPDLIYPGWIIKVPKLK